MIKKRAVERSSSLTEIPATRLQPHSAGCRRGPHAMELPVMLVRRVWSTWNLRSSDLSELPSSLSSHVPPRLPLPLTRALVSHPSPPGETFPRQQGPDRISLAWRVAGEGGRGRGGEVSSWSRPSLWDSPLKKVVHNHEPWQPLLHIFPLATESPCGPF